MAINRRSVILWASGVLLLTAANCCWVFRIAIICAIRDLYDDVFPKPFEIAAPSGFQGIIVFNVIGDVNPSRDSGVFRLSLDGRGSQRLLNKYAIYLRSDPRNELIAYCSGNGLFVMDQAGLETRIGSFFGKPVWSPDGDWIICSHLEREGRRKGNWKTFKCSRDGSSISALAISEREIILDWSQDGRWLLVSNCDSGACHFLDARDISTLVAMPNQWSFFQSIFFARWDKTFLCCC